MATRTEQRAGAGVATRKRLRLQSVPASDSIEESSTTEASTLQAVMREIRQLQSERRQQQEEFAEEIRMWDDMLREMEERMQNYEIQLSRRNNRVDERIAQRDSAELDSRETIAKELGFKLKPDNFDGTVPLREFFTQFDLIARAN